MRIQRKIIPKTHEREIIKDFHFERVTTSSRSTLGDYSLHGE